MFHLSQLFSRGHKDDRLHAELNFHVNQQIRHYIAEGLSPEEASRRARIDFGGLDQVKEECRDVRPFRWVESLGIDLRFGSRILLKNKGFAITALLTLALCIGANTAIFSMLYGLVIKPLPYRELGRIVEILSASTKNDIKLPVSVVQYLDYKTHTDAFADLAYCEYEEFTLGGEGHSVRFLGMRTTANLFSVLGLNPVHGRCFAAENNRPGNDKVVILTRSFCKSNFGDEKKALGNILRINGEPYEIIGIAPYTLEALDTRLRFVIPLALTPALANPFDRYFMKPQSHVYGLLEPKETIGAASSKIAAIESHFQAQLPLRVRKMLGLEDSRIELARLQSRQSADIRERLFLLQGGVLFVLLIGCVNVAGLLLARLNSRQGELAVRMALGAGRKMIARLLFVESLLLAFVGAVLGLIFSSGFIRIINHFTTHLLPGKQPFAIDGAILGFTLLTALLAALFIGLFPVLNVFGRNSVGSMNVQMRHSSGGPRTRRMAGALIVTQIAVTLMLLVGAGLLVRSFANVLAVSPGLNTSHLIEARIALTPGYGRERNQAIQQQILTDLNKISGFSSATLAHAAPYAHGQPFYLGFTLLDYVLQPGEKPPSAIILGVWPSYIKTMQIPLMEGRWFNDEDMNSKLPVVVINQDLAHRYFGSHSALGKHLSQYGEIVGVVGNTPDLRWENEWGPHLPYIYTRIQALPIPPSVLCVFIRSSRPAAEAVALLREAIKRIDPDFPVFDVSSMDNLLSESSIDRRAIMLLLGSFALVALFLSAIGIYGTLAYEVSQRTREIGIRGAIGCTSQQTIGLILRQGLWKAGIGLMLGLIGALWLCRFLSSQLFEVLPTDPVAYVAVSVLLLMVAALASYMPARRAARIDPVIALRSE